MTILIGFFLAGFFCWLGFEVQNLLAEEYNPNRGELPYVTTEEFKSLPPHVQRYCAENIDNDEWFRRRDELRKMSRKYELEQPKEEEKEKDPYAGMVWGVIYKDKKGEIYFKTEEKNHEFFNTKARHKASS